jgi:hypothetical protein
MRTNRFILEIVGALCTVGNKIRKSELEIKVERCSLTVFLKVSKK